ncbi:hypothetical protein [Macrococcus bovicus]|uniref:hypothetical protein n=1 Tax=Macrococcus bovicus TaxID=69968 RepID=UPI00140D9175|nr:hypothetical protein [Macrococcus bovicus]
MIVFRYTGSGGPPSEVPAELNGKVKDDGQRISEESIRQPARPSSLSRTAVIKQE